MIGGDRARWIVDGMPDPPREGIDDVGYAAELHAWWRRVVSGTGGDRTLLRRVKGLACERLCPAYDPEEWRYSTAGFEEYVPARFIEQIELSWVNATLRATYAMWGAGIDPGRMAEGYLTECRRLGRWVTLERDAGGGIVFARAAPPQS